MVRLINSENSNFGQEKQLIASDHSFRQILRHGKVIKTIEIGICKCLVCGHTGVNIEKCMQS